MVVIRINANLGTAQYAMMVAEINKQVKYNGVITLPPFCELLNEVPADEEIKVVQQTAEERMENALHRQDLAHVAGLAPDVLRRLDAAVFTTINPALAKEAANVIRLQRELLEGKEWRL